MSECLSIYLKARFERFPQAEGDNQIKELLPCYLNLEKKLGAHVMTALRLR